MQALQTCEPLSRPESAMARLQAVLAADAPGLPLIEDVEAYERQGHEWCMAAECERLARARARLDIAVPVIEVEGASSRRVLRCAQTSVSAAGPLRIARTLYAQRQDGARALCPLERRAGIIEGQWTPRAATQATWVVAHLTPQEGEELLAFLGNMTPSTSSVERLPTPLSTRWEQERSQFDATLRPQETVPPEAVTVAVSLDGVMGPRQDGTRQATRAQAMAHGQLPCGPAGYQEVGCATVSSYDQEGTRLRTRRLARMPASNTQTLKEPRTADVTAALTSRPDVRLVNVADGAADHWTSLTQALPPGEDVLDCSQAVEHLHTALGAAYGEGSPASTARAETLRRTLRDAPAGVEQVLDALCRLRTRFPRRSALHAALAYFRDHRHRMHDAQRRAQGLPIGSGIVEAAGKT